jgi:hypothetical protein
MEAANSTSGRSEQGVRRAARAAFERLSLEREACQWTMALR